MIVDARKLNKAACNRFLVRNRWAVIIFFGSSKTKIKQDGIIALDGKIFGFDDVTDLDFSVLQSVIRDFQRWLLEKCKSGWFKTLGFVQHWKNLQGDVEHAKVKRGDRFWLKLQMLAVELLAKYASSVLNCDDDLDEAKIDTWVKAWTVLLLYPSGTSKGSTAGVVSTPSVVKANSFNSPKCDVTTDFASSDNNFSHMLTARLAPSTGSVPAPSSSSKHSDLELTLDKMSIMFFMCEEKVERFCRIFCSSPISA